jgi:hypothetical protein
MDRTLVVLFGIKSFADFIPNTKKNLCSIHFDNNKGRSDLVSYTLITFLMAHNFIIGLRGKELYDNITWIPA